MNRQRSNKYGRQYQAVQDVIDKQQNKLAFAFNYIFLAVSALFLAQLYWAFQYKRLNLFVCTTLAIDVAYPFFLKFKEQRFSWKLVLLQSTLIPSLLYGAWTLAYPHKTYVYYIPQLLGAVGKIYHQITSQITKDSWTITQDLVKFQSKIEVLVVIYAILSYLIKFKSGWLKLLKIPLLLFIYRIKYYQHYGCQLSWSEIHFAIDRLTRGLLLRQYYQEFYSKICLLSNPFNTHQVVIF